MLRCGEVDELIDAYVRWIRDQFSVREVDTACEITTPFLDRHNDHIVLYVVKRGNHIVISDDGWTLMDLKMSGVNMTESRRSVIESILTSVCN